ncbi:2-keto-4-pentenoate hydratase/2-oxohepta-3-ene-1,7-dioic acid hydratase (catechol pathway) [Reichenbachiella faecimaris]|uniref:2-keto-4-pentenoate hydratase/2-oxohepta-3-ene-1,7-dioic acid hydratase (Catechol pathway) n=1 Tax=Reichenbachiella faecimaris TaxID=692418 RepID=A0A1W2G6L1_REIFA|nr:fumarylacetoacetate hydrolase family protein [Reichenbachiella faecimaris]SMD32253.1 2-keto-4-pentenoate hydratase/2-oxohepta-3-ene-1,7-dioic acid hydratase (catechol pathway) [Reichenbachiella faecimaris]
MTIVGIGKNYVNTLKEMPSPKWQPIIFTKPETTLLMDGAPFEIPAISNEVAYEVELAYRISKKGKNISEANALSHVDAVAVSIDFTAKDVLAKSRENKGPWALAKGFDGATPISDFFPLTQFEDEINFALDLNGKRVQTGNSSLMVYQLPEIIAHVSQFMTLNPGDILLSGTPAHGVGLVKPGDQLLLTLEGENKLAFEVR